MACTVISNKSTSRGERGTKEAAMEENGDHGEEQDTPLN